MNAPLIVLLAAISACAATPPPPATPRPPVPEYEPRVYTCTVEGKVETRVPPPDVWTHNLAGDGATEGVR